MIDAKLALEADPNLLKAHHRLAQAQMHLRRFKAAMQSAKAGHAALGIKADRTTDFTMLMDKIAIEGSLKGDYSGFDGQVLQVSSIHTQIVFV